MGIVWGKGLFSSQVTSRGYLRRKCGPRSLWQRILGSAPGCVEIRTVSWRHPEQAVVPSTYWAHGTQETEVALSDYTVGRYPGSWSCWLEVAQPSRSRTRTGVQELGEKVVICVPGTCVGVRAHVSRTCVPCTWGILLQESIIDCNRCYSQS